MADYFTRFSCLLDVGTPDKAARAFGAFMALRNDTYAKTEALCCGFDLSIQTDPSGSTLWMSIPRACAHRFHEHVPTVSTGMCPPFPRHVASLLR